MTRSNEKDIRLILRTILQEDPRGGGAPPPDGPAPERSGTALPPTGAPAPDASVRRAGGRNPDPVARGDTAGRTTGGGASTKEAPALNAFLAKMIEKGKITNSGTTAAKVKGEKKFGPEGTKALKAFLTLTQNLTVESAFTDPGKTSASQAIQRALDDLKRSVEAAAAPKGVADIDTWKGAKVGTVSFGADPQGLVDYLKFVNIACSTGVNDDFLTKLDLEPPVAGSTTQPTAPAILAARFIGALTPYKFLTLVPPEGKFLLGSLLKISIEAETADLDATTGATAATEILINFTQEYAKPVTFSVGKDADTATVKADKAAALVQAGASSGQATTFTLTMGEKTYTQKVNTYIAGDTINFAQPAAPAASAAVGAERPAAPKPASFSTLAGNLVGRTQQGKTEAGEKAFSMRTIFMRNTGNLAYEAVPAKMIKDVGKRDSFTIRVSNPASSPKGVIFVPVSLPQKMQEASHWTARFIAPVDSAAGGGDVAPPTFALMPVTEIGFNFDGNYADYGAADLPTVSTVSFIPYDQAFKSPGLNVMTSVELLEAGLTQEDLDRSVKDFLVRSDNLLGGSMIATMTVLNAMNSFPQRTYRF